MKKLIALIAALSVVLAVSVTASAEADDFVGSPTNPDAPIIVEVLDTMGQQHNGFTITSYSNRVTLAAEDKSDFEESYQTIVNADSVVSLNSALSSVANKLKVSSKSLLVSDLFYAGCKDGTGHGKIRIRLSSGNFDNFVSLMHYGEDGKWSIVEGATVDNDGILTVSTNLLGSFAVVVSSEKTVSSGTSSSPQTGNTAVAVAAGVLMLGAAAASLGAFKKVTA